MENENEKGEGKKEKKKAKKKKRKLKNNLIKKKKEKINKICKGFDKSKEKNLLLLQEQASLDLWSLQVELFALTRHQLVKVEQEETLNLEC